MLQRAMTSLKTDRDILALVAGDAWMMGALEAVAALGLPDAWIGAGFLRGAVWDRLRLRRAHPAGRHRRDLP